MAPRKVANPRRTAKFYQSSSTARAKKAATDKMVNGRPDQREKRRELAAERRRRGVMGKGGNDMSHTKSNKIVSENASRNRARNRGKK